MLVTQSQRATHSAALLLAVSAFAVVLSAGFGNGVADANTKKGGSPAAQVADGRPWSMTSSDGRSAELTLFPDGTAQMKAGPMTMRPTWTATADGLCLDGMMGRRCMTLKKVKGGFDTYNNGVKGGSLRR